MEKLKLNLSPIGGINFRIYADKYGEEESLLPFSDGNEDSNLFTVLNVLNTFNPKYKHRKGNDKDWMVREGILCEDKPFFHDKMRDNIGQKLYDALFPDKIREALNQKLGKAGSKEDLHLQIQYDADAIQESRLSLYPWQLVNNGQDFLAKRRVILSYLIAHRNLLAAGKRKVKQIKILFVSSSASEKDNQKLKNKELFIRNGLKKAEQEGHACLLTWYELSKEKSTYKKLSAYLTDNINEQEKLPDIIHFDGHGVFKRQCKNPFCPENGSNKIFYPTHRKICTHCKTPLSRPEGFILFEDDEGNPDYISAERFANLVAISKPALVVITACKSALAHQNESVFNGIAQSVLREVPAVVATSFNLSEDSTTNFVEQFYRALGAKQSLLKAVKLASQAMRYYDYEWYRPIIFLRHDGDEDGYLFEFFDQKLNIETQKPDWEKSPAVDVFFGRDKELKTLENLIVENNCRLVTIIGMGGIGKTALAKKLAEKIQGEFNFVIWRSLREAPPLDKILKDLIKFLSNQQKNDLPDNLSDAINVIIQDYLNPSSCLLILDNVESIMQSGELTGQYRKGYEDYRKLFDAIGEREHNSCLLLTSREKPQNLEKLASEDGAVRFRELSGLNFGDVQQFFNGISVSENELKEVCNLYSGNPLFLKLAAKYIKYEKRFQGNIGQFLEEAKFVIGQPLRDSEDERDAIRKMLDWYFKRLSDDNQSDEEQKEITYWLAINREPVSFSELKDDILLSSSKENLPNTLQTLQRRIPLEISENNKYTLQNLLIEYMTFRLVEEVCDEIKTGQIFILKSHTLLKAQAPDYIRETQKRLILKPLVDRFNDFDIYIEDKLDEILESLPKPRQSRQKPKLPKPSYVVGNIINFLTYLDIDLTGYDFSNLAIWQAYLQGVPLHNVNFANTNFSKSVFTKTLGRICSVAFSPDGQILAISDSNREIRLWQLTDGKELCILEDHEGWAWSIAFSPDSQKLASGSDDRTVRLWDVKNGYCIGILGRHTEAVKGVAISPDGKILASCGDDTKIKLWDISTHQLLQTLEEHTDSVWSIAFSPKDSKTLVSGSYDKTVKLWDISTGKCLKTLQAHSYGVRSIAFSCDDETVASCSKDPKGKVKLWNIRTGQLLKTLQGHTNQVRCVTFSSDGNTLASGGEDHTVRLWNVNTDRSFRKLLKDTHSVWSIAFSSDAQTLASGTYDQTVKLWDISQGNCLKTWQGPANLILSIAFSPDAQTLASGSRDKMVRLWDIDTGQCINAFQEHTDLVWSVAFSCDGQTLASAGDDQTVKLWDVSKGECIKTLKATATSVRSLSFSPDGQTLACGSGDGYIRIWRLITSHNSSQPSFQPHNSVRAHTNWVWSLSFSPDSKILASSSGDGTVKLWTVETGEYLKTLHESTNSIRAVAFSPDGQFLACGGDDRVLRLLEIRTGQCIKKFQGHTDWIWSVAFSLDSKTLASGSKDNTVRLWDINTDQCHTVTGHTNFVRTVAFSPDEQILASGGDDETIQLWDIQTSSCARILKAKRLYEGMNITGVNGLTEAEKNTLKILGAIGS